MFEPNRCGRGRCFRASPIVQFAHFSVKEYLTSNRLAMAQAISVSRYHIPTEPAYKIIAQACLSTLLQLDEHIDKERLKNYPLAFCAALHWVDHARIGDVTSSILDHMEQLFNSDKPYFSAWIGCTISIKPGGHHLRRTSLNAHRYPKPHHFIIPPHLASTV
jgi:hypothetical protein